MPADLDGRHILVVEDEYMIAAMIEQMLEDAGAIVAVAGSIEQALALLEARAFDAALLDLNLDGRKSLPVADALAARAVPFVFATGYGDGSIDGEHALRAVLGKPFREAALLETVAALLRGAH